jgi:hypothetical protein
MTAPVPLGEDEEPQPAVAANANKNVPNVPNVPMKSDRNDEFDKGNLQEPNVIAARDRRRCIKSSHPARVRCGISRTPRNVLQDF